MKKFSIIFTALLMLTLIMSPLLVSADDGNGGTVISGITSETPGTLDIGDTISKVTNWLLGLLIALSLLFVVYAAFLYLLGGQDEANIGKAKNIIIYAAIAIVIGLGAKALETIVTSIISTS